MSSKSPNPRKNEILIIGDSWVTAIFADAFLRRKTETTILNSPPATGPSASSCTLHVGTGEPRKRVELSMGKPLTDTLWSLSEKNYTRAKSFFSGHRIPIVEEGLQWYQGSEKAELENALIFDPDLVQRTAPFEKITRVLSIEKKSLSYLVTFDKNGKTEKKTASLIVFLAESQALTLFPFLRDKVIPVTLSTFQFSATDSCPKQALSLFNGGADFAIRESGKIRTGSFRNLYEDHAVGVHTEPDPKTLEGVTRFFGDKKWIDPKEKPKAFLSLETMTCDGLALVGTLPDLPGVYFAGGFTARTSGFIFEVADQVAESVLGSGSLDKLGCFSMKRFV